MIKTLLITAISTMLLSSCANPSITNDDYSYTYSRHHRSQKAKNNFKQMNPCPSTGKNYGTCPGYIIDHINPIACGGADDPVNMQWQSQAEAKAKDKWERKLCQTH